VITGAPGAAFLVAATFFLAIWYFVKCDFSHTLSAKDSALSSKDASIESLNERLLLQDDRIRDLQQEKDTMVQQLSQVAQHEPKELIVQVKSLRAELDERKRREWQLLSREQETQLVEALQRFGTEELGERTMSLLGMKRLVALSILHPNYNNSCLPKSRMAAERDTKPRSTLGFNSPWNLSTRSAGS
jgi:septal ring factor EnvC (AmiA/AmiB activator)